ncbi:LamG domain-containing protein [Crocosphaera watsonii WH 8501]|nr:LamG domain-containing protein [Crocosphaera watsonii]
MAYYPLNGDASDSTSNKNHGTIHGGTWTQENLEFLEPLKGTEKPANVDREQNPQSVLNFDGQDDYIEIQEPFENNRYFTISLWINPAILNSNFRGFIGKQEEAYRQPGMWVGPSGNELHYDSYDTSGQRYFSILNNFFESKDKWVHIAWVKENTEYKIYRNGELFAMEPAPTNFYTTNTNYWLGRVDNFFQGKITEVRIWNKARTQDEITQDMNHRLTGKEEGLMAYYPLNGDASDSTSNNNHGTIHGGTWTQENLEFLEPLKTNI